MAAGPHSPWTIELTNSAAETYKFHKIFPKPERDLVGLKGYFIHQDFLTLGAPEAGLDKIF